MLNVQNVKATMHIQGIIDISIYCLTTGWIKKQIIYDLINVNYSINLIFKSNSIQKKYENLLKVHKSKSSLNPG